MYVRVLHDCDIVHVQRWWCFMKYVGYAFLVAKTHINCSPTCKYTRTSRKYADGYAKSEKVSVALENFVEKKLNK